LEYVEAMNKTFLAILIHNGKQIAMQIFDAEDHKAACSEADKTADHFSGRWVDVIEVLDSKPVNLNEVINNGKA